MGSRGFSLVSALVVVAALMVTIILPLPLTRDSRALGQAELDTTRSAARIACLGLGPGTIARMARERISTTRTALCKEAQATAPPRSRARLARPWQPLGSGIEHRVVEVGSVQMHQVRMDPTRARLDILYAPSLGSHHDSVGSMARQKGAMAAINASYFGTDDRPLGYLKFGGKAVVPSIATGAAFTAVFCMRGARARIVPREQFRPQDADLALQAGPRLVAGGKPTQGLRETRSFRQSGIAVAQDGRVIIYATDGFYRGLTWEETRTVLTGPEGEGGIAPRDVLNLDGGSSSQMYVNMPGRAAILTGMGTPVPVGIAFLPPSPRRPPSARLR